MVNKEKIVRKIAKKSGMTKNTTYKFMEAFIDVLTQTLSDGEKFYIHKVFAMEPTEKKARTAHNPKTMEAVEIPAYKRVKTTIGKELKAAVNVHTTKEEAVPDGEQKGTVPIMR